MPRRRFERTRILRYAKTTTVSVERSKAEVEKTLKRYGIKEFFFGSSPKGDGFGFKHDGNVYKINMPHPNPDDFSTDKQFEQACRQRWRIMLLSMKADLEKIEIGLISFDDQFLYAKALPDGSTVSDFMKLPENKRRLEKAEMPKMLTGK